MVGAHLSIGCQNGILRRADAQPQYNGFVSNDGDLEEKVEHQRLCDAPACLVEFTVFFPELDKKHPNALSNESELRGRENTALSLMS